MKREPDTMAARSADGLKQAVLAAYRNLGRARRVAFAGDDYALQSTRMAANGSHRPLPVLTCRPADAGRGLLPQCPTRRSGPSLRNGGT